MPWRVCVISVTSWKYTRLQSTDSNCGKLVFSIHTVSVTAYPLPFLSKVNVSHSLVRLTGSVKSEVSTLC